MWQRRCEQTIIIPAMTATRSGIARELFKTRGTHSFLVPEQAEPAKNLTRTQMEWLEAQMTAAGSEYICTGKLTIVDVQLFILLRFMTTFDLSGPEAKGAIPLPELLQGLPWIEAWYKRMEARPSASAGDVMMSEEKGAMVLPRPVAR